MEGILLFSGIQGYAYTLLINKKFETLEYNVWKKMTYLIKRFIEI